MEMENNPILAILLCALCIPAVLPSGPLGSPGSLGSSRSPGSSGSPGPLGSPGSLGSPGPSGPSGSPGSLGSPGPSGPSGSPGSLGSSGSPGPSGPPGSLGSSGSPGPSGSPGSSGSPGPSGSPGSSGSPESSGSPGPSGSPGSPGSSGSLGLENLPLQLKARIAVNSTPCSVTCGLGIKEQQLCEVTRDGISGNCSLLRSLCLSDWICGLQHLSVPVGKPIRLTCLSPNATIGLERHNFSCTWQFARGLITTNDLLFHPLRNPSPSLSFPAALESHSGTYRCDVQEVSSFKLVKRIYFGLRVVPMDLVDLNFQESLSWEQQLAAGGAERGNGSGAAEKGKSREKQWFYELVLGIGSGVILGVVFSVGLCCLARMCRRREEK